MVPGAEALSLVVAEVLPPERHSLGSSTLVSSPSSPQGGTVSDTQGVESRSRVHPGALGRRFPLPRWNLNYRRTRSDGWFSRCTTAIGRLPPPLPAPGRSRPRLCPEDRHRHSGTLTHPQRAGAIAIGRSSSPTVGWWTRPVTQTLSRFRTPRNLGASRRTEAAEDGSEARSLPKHSFTG